jgi:hypothetical protein
MAVFQIDRGKEDQTHNLSSPASCGRPNFLFPNNKMGCPDKPGNDEAGLA